MIDMTKLLEMLATAFPYVKFSGDNAKTYALFLQSVPMEDLQIAVMQVIEEKEAFFPTIAEIKQRAAENMLLKDGVPGPERAYQIAMSADKNTRFDYPLVVEAAAISAGSTGNLKRSEHPPSARASFIKAYSELYRLEKLKKTAVPMVAGYMAQIEEDNTIPELTAGKG